MDNGRNTVNDLKRRLRDIEGFAPPDLWDEIRTAGPRPAPPAESSSERRLLVAALALVLGLTGVLVVVRAFGGWEPATEPATPVRNGLIAFVGEVSSDLFEGGIRTEIFAMNPDGTGRIQLTDDPKAFHADPAWSPDGTQIAFIKVGDLTTPGIYVMDADGSDPRLILEDPTGPTSPSWSPDGRTIVFETGLGEESTGSGDRDIYEVEVATGELTRLTSDLARDEYPALSPDGSRIAFTRQRDGDADIYVMNADGSGVTRLTGAEGIALRPAWSPDGSRIVFQRGGGIYVMGADGSGVTPLTDGPAKDRGPTWAPDGTQIAFVRNGDIYVMDLEGGNLTNLTSVGDYPGLSWRAVGSAQSGVDDGA